LKDSPLQKSIYFGSNAPACIPSLQQQNDAGSAIAEQFACLPISSVPKKKTIWHIPRNEKERSCTAR